jgi:hypothetical protein
VLLSDALHKREGTVHLSSCRELMGASMRDTLRNGVPTIAFSETQRQEGIESERAKTAQEEVASMFP